MPRNEVAPSPEVIEGEYEVILPPPPVQWSFWRDDWPNLWRILATPPIAGLVAYVVHHALR